MNGSSSTRVAELIQEATSLPYGAVRVSLLEEAERLASVARDLDATFDARINLARATLFSGAPEKAMAAFAWCLAQFEKDPERFRSHQYYLLWFFKSILGQAVDMPQMSMEQIKSMRNQMAAMHRQSGYNARPLHHARFVFATSMGDRPAASEFLAKWRAQPRDGMANCTACETDVLVEYYELMDELEKAVEAAEPNLSGKQSCTEVPHRTYNMVLRPLALLGRYEEADKYQKKGYRLIRNNRSFIYHVALQMLYLVHRKRIPPALRMLERHLTWALETYELRSRFMFYLAAGRLLTHLAHRRSSHKLALPQAFPAYEPSAQYDLATLIDWFDTQRIALGKRFDERNGNTFFSEELVARLHY